MSKNRQAVILIHGIGEQRPMETLRSFMDAVWISDKTVKHKNASHTDAAGQESGLFSKPDRVSDHFELRRLTTTKNINGVTTDFFEYYWAHRLQGTRIAHVVGWARRLLLRSPAKLPATLRSVWYIIIGLALATIIMGIVALVTGRMIAVSAAVTTGIGFLTAWFITPVVLNIIGDAARYLDPAPSNIASRQAIRQAGVEMLLELHRRKTYDRIILVGHSLGSVIAYDILTHAWPHFNGIQKDDWKDRPSAEILDEMEAMLQGPPFNPIRFRELQHALHLEQRDNGNAWLVTDFVTLGSPLTYAEVLLAVDRNDLEKKQLDRELPSCPPKSEIKRIRSTLETTHVPDINPEEDENEEVPTEDEQENWQCRKYISYPHRNKHKRNLHHAAVFAVTRWTNLFFPTKGVIRGDFIGGPLAEQFGDGIKDIAVATDQRNGLFSHTLYWRAKDLEQEPRHIRELRKAINLLNK